MYSVDVACDSGSTRPWSALMKTDLVSGALSCWRAPARCYISEPSFAAGPGDAEDDGWLLLLMFDATLRRSALVLLSAKDVAAGPVCTLCLRHHIPISTHTMWTSESFGLSSSSRL